jgi:hypothetical protein
MFQSGEGLAIDELSLAMLTGGLSGEGPGAP